MDGVRQFLTVVPNQAHVGNNPTGRMKPLVGMPLVGVGLGGAEYVKGDVVRALIEVLHQAVESRDIDIALVVRGEPAFYGCPECPTAVSREIPQKNAKHALAGT